MSLLVAAWGEEISKMQGFLSLEFSTDEKKNSLDSRGQPPIPDLPTSTSQMLGYDLGTMAS